MKLIWKLISTFFGFGLIPLAPGTAASLAMALLYKFVLRGLSWPYYLILLLALHGLGVAASSFYSAEFKRKDPRPVVIDEVCGQLVVLFGVAPSWTPVLLGFILFRFFDIVKPYPITRVEKLPRGWGIMADDLLAALAAKLILHLYLFLS